MVKLSSSSEEDEDGLTTNAQVEPVVEQLLQRLCQTYSVLTKKVEPAKSVNQLLRGNCPMGDKYPAVP